MYHNIGDVKRRRSDPPSKTERPPKRDIYDEICQTFHAIDEPNDENYDEIFQNTIHSSWLTNVYWISSPKDTSIEEEVPSSHEDVQDIIMTGKDEHNTDNIQSEIKHIQSQLIQVKRRLGPAAERSTEAYNAKMNGDATTGRKELKLARRACNPMEVLGEGQEQGLNDLFINRSAMKLANIDAALGFILTTTTSTNHNDDGVFSFADLCASPGGFSEYLMWRCRETKRVRRGYGISLIGSDEYGNGVPWKLRDTFNKNGNEILQYRICYGDGTGDIYRWENVEMMRRIINEDGDPDDAERGKVDLVVADGGFDAQRDAENQEGVAQKLVVCESAASLALLRRGGTMVIKMFGFQTLIIRTVMKELFLLFDNLIAIKPICSRPASAERYVVCCGFRGCPSGWDGPRWITKVLLGDISQQDPSLCRSATERRLFRYLDEFDRDLFSLNIKACFSILSYLEMRCMEYNRQRKDDDQSDMEAEETDKINLASYRYAWRLG